MRSIQVKSSAISLLPEGFFIFLFYAIWKYIGLTFIIDSALVSSSLFKSIYCFLISGYLLKGIGSI